MSNSKTFEVTLVDSSFPQTVEAVGVEETSTRVRFVGRVEGVSGNEVVVSYLNASVESYRMVPTPELDAKIVGKYLYQVNFSGGKTHNVQADAVKHQTVEAGNGRYVFITNMGAHYDTRTEYVVPEADVTSIERIELETATATTVVNNVPVKV